MSEPEIKVTKIKNRYHARLIYEQNIIDEMACQEKQDIGFICKQLMRWFDKSLFEHSKYASACRSRESSNNQPLGKIWYRVDLD